MKEEEFVKKINNIGGRVFLVGGWVRDYLRGIPARDKDYLLTGVSQELFEKMFLEAKNIGKSFPVYSFKIDGKYVEVALARTEKKISQGYKGFCVHFSPDINVEEDLFRRDVTINAMAMELPNNKIIDPFLGKIDLANRLMRAVSNHFLEDPIRSLRVARQAAMFDFRVEKNTLLLMKKTRQELLMEPGERIFKEMAKALQAKKPSRFFYILWESNLFDAIFFDISYFTNREEFNKEKTLRTLDLTAKMTDDVIGRFAAFIYDLGDIITSLEDFSNKYDFEKNGIEILDKINTRVNLPTKWYQVAFFIIQNSKKISFLETSTEIINLILAINKQPVAYKAIISIFLAIYGDLPYYLEKYDEFLNEILSIKGSDAPKILKGKQIGEWIYEKQKNIIDKKMVLKSN